MKQIIRMELARAFKNKAFYFALLAGILLALWHFFCYGMPLIRNILDVYTNAVGESYFDKVKYAIPVTQVWMGTSNIGTELYFFMMPLLGAIPYGASYCADCRSGYISNIVTRVSKAGYYRAKLLAVFLSSSAVCTAPLLLELILCMCFAPVMFPLSGSRLFPVFDSSWLSGLFYSSYSLLYIFIYLLFDFITWGLIGCISLAATWVEDNRFAVMMAPFIFCFGLHVIAGWIIGDSGYSPMVYTFFPKLYAKNLPVIIFELIVFAALAVWFVVRKRDEGI